ncbi:MAG: general stress protein CsbD [Bacteroidota bacterium]|nr:general stress protein CsbD [Bacteroidota bacterium]
MNKKEVSGSRNKLRGKPKRKFSIITNYELMPKENYKVDVFKKLQIDLGKTKEELHKIILALFSST